MLFADFQLAPPILKAVVECGYETPTPIQAEAIPAAMNGRDLIASAQTGTGKTAAFMLPLLHRLVSVPLKKRRGPRVLVLSPTRELAEQITQATRGFAKYLAVQCVSILGGMPYPEQIRALGKFPEIVVATPGRLIDHLERRRIDLSGLEVLVLDEADRMLDMGFIGDVQKIAAAGPKERQTLLFAATMGDAVARLARNLMKDPVRIQVAGKEVAAETIEQRLLVADNQEHKSRILNHLITDGTITRAIIFSRTKRGADRLAYDLHAKGHAAVAMHGDMKQSERNRAIADLHRGRIRLLVATDVAARGLDISGISHIINFDLPKSSEDYVNRIGRTGRAGASGIAISLASLKDIAELDRIESYLGKALPRHQIAGLEPSSSLRTAHSGKAAGNGSGRRSRRVTRPFHQASSAPSREWGR